MKKSRSFCLVCAAMFSVASMSAEVALKSIGDKDGKLEIVMEDREAGDNVMVTSAKLINDGKEVCAVMMMCKLDDGVGTYTLTFPMQKAFVSPAVAMTINGEESVTCIDGKTAGIVIEAEVCDEEISVGRCPFGCED